VRAAWDPSTDWQLSAVAARTEKGENLLGTPYVPGSPPVPSSGLTGVVEKTRDLEGSVRWWPAGGVDLAMTLGYEWIDQAGHVPGARERGARGTFAVRVAR
jgi:hypothetical protein